MAEINNELYNQHQTFIKSPIFYPPHPEEDSFPTYTSSAYQKLVIPKEPQEYLNLYTDIVSEINNKIKEINYSHGLYESTGMITITDTNFIKNLTYILDKTNQNFTDILFYRNDLQKLKLSFANQYHSSILSLREPYPINDIEYYSNLDYFLVFSNQLISVSANEILEIITKNDSISFLKINNLYNLIKSVKRTITYRLSYEIIYHQLDLTTINDLINQNNSLLDMLDRKLNIFYHNQTI